MHLVISITKLQGFVWLCNVLVCYSQVCVQGLSRTIKVHATPTATFSVNTDNEEAMENVHIKRVEFKLNVRAFFRSPGTKQTVRNK